MPKQSRQTKQKELIAHIISSFETFFTAEDVHEKIKKEDPKIGIATIYRYLKECTNNKSLYSYTCDRKSIYSKEKTNHCHFICETTGKTFHFEIDSLDFLKDKIPGQIKSFQLEVRGICPDCEDKEKKEKKCCSH